MENNKKKISFRLLVLITTPRLAEHAEDIFRQDRLPMLYRCKAEGTASSEIMNLLGLDSVEKRVLMSILPRNMTGMMLEKLKSGLRMHRVNSGIAFTMPVNGINAIIFRMFEQNMGEEVFASLGKDEMEMAETKNVLISVIVNRGFSAEVMEAAKSAGAKGGTVIRSRRVGSEEAAGFWGIGVQEEKEVLMILADEQNKVDIMKRVSEQYGMHSDAQGMVISMPVDSVIGV